MTPIEITGIFAKVLAAVEEYGKLTDQDHIRFASHIGLNHDHTEIVTIHFEDTDVAYGYGERVDLQLGAVPILALTDMPRAVSAYRDKQTEERERKKREEHEAGRRHYNYLRSIYEPAG